jgi:hypothetical protein
MESKLRQAKKTRPWNLESSPWLLPSHRLLQTCAAMLDGVIRDSRSFLFFAEHESSRVICTISFYLLINA